MNASPNSFDAVSKGGRDDIVEGEIDADLGVVDGEALAPHLLGIIAPVVAGEVDIGALGGREGAQVRLLLGRPVARRRPDLFEEIAHRGGRLRHRVVELVGGEAAETEQCRPLGAQAHRLGHDGAVVVGVAVLAAPDPGLIGLLAQVAPAGILQERHDQRARQGDEVPASAALGRGLGGGVAHALGQTGEIGLAVERQFIAAFVRQHVLAEGGAEHREPLDDGGEPLLVRRPEPGAAPHEIVEGELQNPRLLVVEPEGGRLGMDGLDAPEQPLVHRDRLIVAGEQRRHLPFDGLERRVGMRARQVPEHPAHPRQQPPRSLQRQQRVREIRRTRIGDDGRDLGRVLRHPPLEGRHDVLGADRAEGREAERGGPGSEEGVGGGGVGHGGSGQGCDAARRGPRDQSKNGGGRQGMGAFDRPGPIQVGASFFLGFAMRFGGSRKASLAPDRVIGGLAATGVLRPVLVEDPMA